MSLSGTSVPLDPSSGANGVSHAGRKMRSRPIDTTFDGADFAPEQMGGIFVSCPTQQYHLCRRAVAFR